MMGKQGKEPVTKKNTEQKKEEKPRWRNLIGISLLVVGVSVLAWVGISELGASDQKKADELVKSTEVKPTKNSTETDRDFLGTLKPTDLGTFPESIANSNDDAKKAYRFASDVENHSALKASSCYCGCQRGLGHTSLLDCYIEKLLPGDQVIYAEHGNGCRLCVVEALSVEVWSDAGKSDEEIRKLVDEKFGP